MTFIHEWRQKERDRWEGDNERLVLSRISGKVYAVATIAFTGIYELNCVVIFCEDYVSMPGPKKYRSVA